MRNRERYNMHLPVTGRPDVRRRLDHRRRANVEYIEVDSRVRRRHSFSKALLKPISYIIIYVHESLEYFWRMQKLLIISTIIIIFFK